MGDIAEGAKISALFVKDSYGPEITYYMEVSDVMKIASRWNVEFLSGFNQKVTHEIICSGRRTAAGKSLRLQKQWSVRSDALHDVDVPVLLWRWAAAA